jgi:hypothetical protein
MPKVEIDGKVYALIQEEVVTREQSREDKMSEFAQSRERDSQGRFVGQVDDVEAFYYTPYRVVWRPNAQKSHVVERHEELHWYQRVYYLAAFCLGLSAVCALIVAL